MYNDWPLQGQRNSGHLRMVAILLTCTGRSSTIVAVIFSVDSVEEYSVDWNGIRASHSVCVLGGGGSGAPP